MLEEIPAVVYQGFTSKYDEVLPFNSDRIAPFGHRSKTKTVYRCGHALVCLFSVLCCYHGVVLRACTVATTSAFVIPVVTVTDASLAIFLSYIQHIVDVDARRRRPTVEYWKGHVRGSNFTSVPGNPQFVSTAIVAVLFFWSGEAACFGYS